MSAFDGYVSMSCCGGPMGTHDRLCPDARPAEPECESCGVPVVHEGDLCDHCEDFAREVAREREWAMRDVAA